MIKTGKYNTTRYFSKDCLTIVYSLESESSGGTTCIDIYKYGNNFRIINLVNIKKMNECFSTFYRETLNYMFLIIDISYRFVDLYC